MQAASQNLTTFVLSRFFVGCGIEFAIMPAPVLITEVAYPTHRGKMAALYNCFFYLGAIAASWTTFGTFPMAGSSWSWRIPSLLQAAFPLIQLLFIWFVPESPRWLVGQRRYEEARAILVEHHTAGDSESPLVDFQMAEIKSSIDAAAADNALGWSSVSIAMSLWLKSADKFTSSGLPRRTRNVWGSSCSSPFSHSGPETVSFPGTSPWSSNRSESRTPSLKRLSTGSCKYLMLSPPCLARCLSTGSVVAPSGYGRASVC